MLKLGTIFQEFDVLLISDWNDWQREEASI